MKDVLKSLMILFLPLRSNFAEMFFDRGPYVLEGISPQTSHMKHGIYFSIYLRYTSYRHASVISCRHSRYLLQLGRPTIFLPRSCMSRDFNPSDIDHDNEVKIPQVQPSVSDQISYINSALSSHPRVLIQPSSPKSLL